MISVLFVESGRTGGGSFESLYQHLRVIDRGRFRPVVVSLNHNYWVRAVRELGVPVHVLVDGLYSRHAPPRMRRVAAELRLRALQIGRLIPSAYLKIIPWIHRPLIDSLTRLVRSEGIDILHLNVQVYRDLFGLFAARKTGAICISHLRSADPRTRHEFRRSMAAFSNDVVAGFIANSNMTAEYWWERGIAPGKTWIVHNAIPPSESTPFDVRETWRIADRSAFIVGCVAPLRNRIKVDEFLVRGFARFLKRYPNAVLLVVGEGPMKEVLDRESRALGVKNHVIFAGFQENAKGIIGGLDVSLVLSSYDSFSRVVLETMEAGTCLVATDAGGVREIVQHEQNGLLIPYGDEEAFANAVERLAADDQLRSKLIENGRQTIQEHFSIQRYASDIEKIYLHLAAERQPSEIR